MKPTDEKYFKLFGYVASEHFVERLQEREIKRKAARKVLTNGVKILKDGRTEHYYNGVCVVSNKKNLITVYRKMEE